MMACHSFHTWCLWQKSQMKSTLLLRSPPPSQWTSLQTRGAPSRKNCTVSFSALTPNNLVLTTSNPQLHQPCSLKGPGNSLHASPLCVCWYYQQTVWLCLSECDDRTKHWYLPCDNHRVWTSSVQNLGVWDWQSACVLRVDAPYL